MGYKTVLTYTLLILTNFAFATVPFWDLSDQISRNGKVLSLVAAVCQSNTEQRPLGQVDRVSQGLVLGMHWFILYTAER